MTRRKVIIEHDSNPDFSWLDQDHYDPRHPSYDPVYPSRADMRAKRNAYDGDWYRNPDNHVALCMVTYEFGPRDTEWRVIDSLGGIDFLVNSDDWETGTFYTLKSMKPRSYLRSLAKESGLR